MITAAQINPEPLLAFHRRFGGYVERKRDARGFRSTHQWRLSARQAVPALVALRPYLVVKASEADLAIQFQSSQQSVVAKTPEEVLRVLTERESMYQMMRQMKKQAFETVILPRSDRVGPKVGGRRACLTAGPGTGHPNPRKGRAVDPMRLAAMHEMRREGKTYEAIGAAYGIKRAAAHHILKRWADG